MSLCDLLTRTRIKNGFIRFFKIVVTKLCLLRTGKIQLGLLPLWQPTSNKKIKTMDVFWA